MSATVAEGARPLDEILDAAGRLRPAWRRLLSTLLGLGTATLAARAGQLARLLAEEGPASLTAMPGGAWRCDPVPFVLEAETFAALEAGLAARAALLGAMLEDVYGAGALVRGGVLPPASVFGAGGYVPACRFWPGGAALTFYAADLVHRADGQWCVIADHCGVPAGLGRALLHRRMMARVLPELFGCAEVAEPGGFLARFAAALGPPGAPVALLTPGHADAGWFEHMRLAQELGAALVQPGDLTVRQGRLWLKTLRGLQPVTGVLRMAPGEALDPLELPGEGGVPGLLAAARGGRVALANGPGSAWAGTPGVAAFLPRAAHALGQGAGALPGVETLWLGDADARARAGEGYEIVGFAGPEAGAAWRARPWAYAARLVPEAGFAPAVGRDEVLEPVPLHLRLFLMRGAAGWEALPGGLAWVASGPMAGTAKDVWVLRGAAPARDEAGGAPGGEVAVRRSVGELPSRVADDFFWFGRYVERLEHAARLSRAVLGRLRSGGLLPHELPEVAALAWCLADAGVLSAELAAGAGPEAVAGMLTGALTGAGGALAAAKRDVEALAEALRDRMSGEMHAMIVHGVRTLDAEREALLARPDPAVRPGVAALAAYVGRVIEFCAGVSGYVAENMVRGGGRLFLDLGRRIERSQGTAAALARVLGAAPEEAGLSLALELCDSAITYRTRYAGRPMARPVLDLVLADEDNPRSLCFQLEAARALLGVLAAGLAWRLDEAAAAARGMAAGGELGGVGEGLWRVRAEAAAVSDAVTRRYFSLAAVTWTGTQR